MAKIKTPSGSVKTARGKRPKRLGKKNSMKMFHWSRTLRQLLHDRAILATCDSRFHRIISRFLPLTPASCSQLKSWVVDQLIEAKHTNKRKPDHIVAKIIRLSWEGFREA